MIKRELVAEERGRRWMSGDLSAPEYFRAVRGEARELARQTVADRLRRLMRPGPA